MTKNKKKKNTQTKNETLSYTTIRIIIVVIGVLVGIGMLFIGYKLITEPTMTEQQRVVNLEESIASLGNLYDSSIKLVNDKQIDHEKSSNILRYCGQSSAKYGEGIIRCGGSGEITYNSLEDLSFRKEKMQELITNTVGYSVINAGNVHRLLDKSGETFEIRYTNIHDSDIDCRNSVTTDEKLSTTRYYFSCFRIVSDFLPGYEIR